VELVCCGYFFRKQPHDHREHSSIDMEKDIEFFDAVRSNNMLKLQAFLDSGVDPNLVDEHNGSTALHFAAIKGARQCVEILLKYGVNVNAQNTSGT
jgi:ankyrin repeat protein